jgi:hypothetical protein
MEEIDEADEIYTKIADSATAAPTDPRLRVRVGSPMVEDPVVEPLRASSPAPSISSRATGHSKMEVVIDKGKGKKVSIVVQHDGSALIHGSSQRSRQDLTQEESTAEVMITHATRCQMCVSTSTACVGPQGKSCLKCTQRKTACMYAQRGKAVGGSASAGRSPLRLQLDRMTDMLGRVAPSRPSYGCQGWPIDSGPRGLRE